MRKKIVFSLLGLGGLLGVGMGLSTRVRADDNTTYPPVVQMLAQKFGLDEGAVKSAFDEWRQQKLEQRRQMEKEGLEQAVADGVITEAQMQALLEKRAQLADLRRQAWEEQKNWMEEQGIDPVKLGGYMRLGRGHGPIN